VWWGYFKEFNHPVITRLPKNQNQLSAMCNGHTKGEHLFTAESAESAESAEFQRVFSAFLAHSAVKFLFALSVTNTQLSAMFIIEGSHRFLRNLTGVTGIFPQSTENVQNNTDNS
jgi:hypothetical protein